VAVLTMRHSDSRSHVQPIAGFAALLAALVIAAGADASPQAPAAAAKLHGPSGCVSRTFTATLTADSVASVAFRVDGKRVGTRTAKDGQRRFEIRVNPTRVGFGVHHLTADITPVAGTQQEGISPRLAFRRCEPRTAVARFPG